MNINRALSMISLATKAGKTKERGIHDRKRSQGRTRASGDCGRRTHRTIQKRNFRTCVIFIKCQYTFLKIKIPWAMRWEKSSALRLQ